MKTSFIYAAKAALYLLLLTGIFAACSNSTSSEEEQEAVGLRVKQNSQTVLEQNASGDVTGSLSVASQTSTTFTVFFVDEDGAEFTPEPIEEHTITFSPASAIISITNVNHDSAPFSFDLEAQDVGNTTFTVTLNHQGAAEFVTSAFSVEVTGSN